MLITVRNIYNMRTIAHTKWVCLFFLAPGRGRAETVGFIGMKPLFFRGMKRDWFWGMKRRLCKCVSILLLSMGRCRCVTEVWNGVWNGYETGTNEKHKCVLLVRSAANKTVFHTYETVLVSYLWNGRLRGDPVLETSGSEKKNAAIWCYQYYVVMLYDIWYIHVVTLWRYVE